MSDPWEDVRERDNDTDEWLERNWGWGDTAGAGLSRHELAHEDRKRLLTDADALLAVVRLAKKAEGRPIDTAQTQEFHRAYVSLSEHLKHDPFCRED